eukprot:539726-Amphidinium_carterae.1
MLLCGDDLWQIAANQSASNRSTAHQLRKVVQSFICFNMLRSGCKTEARFSSISRKASDETRASVVCSESVDACDSATSTP